MAQRKVDLEATITAFFNALNTASEKEELNKTFTFKARSSKKETYFKVYSNDLNTNKRRVVYEKQYEINVKDQLKGDWKLDAYADFLYEGMVYFLIQKDSTIEKDNLKEIITLKNSL